MENINLENLSYISKWYMNDITTYKQWLEIMSGMP
jgi:hypothetical protein